ncbi:membrane transporter [Aspergillus steynii IBT 23096]|uniref:Membrane transporter n=1 Tax=Aspergillus steynii IBT 23096 TaxID=1392250 RepID=A0A2I2FU81_9EURO|nr:membrane transporter [Aspergillus steynii IBT 23096]PLB44126.1 membrane transporter [Aspergillus steynii IBT 23096]
MKRWFEKRTHPLFQNFVAGQVSPSSGCDDSTVNNVTRLVLFLQPGFYLALTGLGAGGGRPSSLAVAATANWILYLVFFLTGWLGGVLMNLMGPRVTMALSAVGYTLYTGGLWYLDKTGHSWMAYLGGAIEGVCASLLWTSAGAIAYSYAEEKQKARYVTYQWMCCATGSTIASLMMLGINFHQRTDDARVPESIYGSLVGLQVASMFIAAVFLVRPSAVVRSDGQNIARSFESTWKAEIWSHLKMFAEPGLLELLPPMLVGEIALALQSSLNGYFFNIRTRCLNNFIFSAVQIPASWGISRFLDSSFLKRRARTLAAICLVALFTVGACTIQTVWLLMYRVDRRRPGPSTDWRDEAFKSTCYTYILSGVVYGTFQMVTQYVITSLTNDPLKLARYSGAFRGVNALGMMASFIIDSQGVNYIYQQWYQFGAYNLGIISLGFAAYNYVTQTNYNSEPNVIVPIDVQNQSIPLQSISTGNDNGGEQSQATGAL